MLGNLKDFISVVQDGLNSNNNLRHTLQEVQKMRNIFKDKQKAARESDVDYGAGSELLEMYQEQWATIHQNADQNAKAAEEVDKLISEIHEKTKTQLQRANELAHNLTYLPNLTATVAQCMNGLKNVQQLLRNVEEELVDFEDIVERSKMEKWKLDHHYQLCLYKEKKMASLEEIRCNLAKENTTNTYQREKQQLAELQLRRDQSAKAFQQDITKYLTSGSITSGAATTSKITLEQVELCEDNNDLETFLES